MLITCPSYPFFATLQGDFQECNWEANFCSFSHPAFVWSMLDFCLAQMHNLALVPEQNKKYIYLWVFAITKHNGQVLLYEMIPWLDNGFEELTCFALLVEYQLVTSASSTIEFSAPVYVSWNHKSANVSLHQKTCMTLISNLKSASVWDPHKALNKASKNVSNDKREQ